MALDTASTKRDKHGKGINPREIGTLVLAICPLCKGTARRHLRGCPNNPFTRKKGKED